MGATAKKFSGGEVPDQVAHDFLRAVETVARATAPGGWFNEAHFRTCLQCMQQGHLPDGLCDVGQALHDAHFGATQLQKHLSRSRSASRAPSPSRSTGSRTSTET